MTCELGGPVSPYLIGRQDFYVFDLLNPDVSYDCHIPPYPVPHMGGTGVVLYGPRVDKALFCGGYAENQGWKSMSCSHCQELCQQASWLLIGCTRVNNQSEARSAS